MHFGTISKSDPAYSKIMMQKHLDMKRQRRNLTVSGQNNYHEAHRSSLQEAEKKNYKVMNEDQRKMKSLFKEQIEQCLENYRNMKTGQVKMEKETGKVMAKQNGLLDYLQAEQRKRNDFIVSCLIKQEARKQSFVDEPSLKNRSILHHIDNNYDKDLFMHESDKWQAKQKINEAKTWQINKDELNVKREQRKKEKSEYGLYLEERYSVKNHNPIVNPMEYYIGNPYFAQYTKNK